MKCPCSLCPLHQDNPLRCCFISHLPLNINKLCDFDVFVFFWRSKFISWLKIEPATKAVIASSGEKKSFSRLSEVCNYGRPWPAKWLWTTCVVERKVCRRVWMQVCVWYPGEEGCSCHDVSTSVQVNNNVCRRNKVLRAEIPQSSWSSNKKNTPFFYLPTEKKYII